MSLNEQKRLFSRFSQATPRTHVKYGGSGLGLFISKSLTSLQGGAIGVHSEKDVGSTFAFFVGTRLAHPPSGASTHAPQVRPQLQRADSIQEAMQAVKLDVLIVEDNLVNQKVLKKQLQKFGWNVSVAGNGQEALEWLKESVYWRSVTQNGDEKTGANERVQDVGATEGKHELDIILMDIEMPIMDGLTCSRLIRDYEQQGLLSMLRGQNGAQQRNPRIPILAVSANARMEQIEQALASGMDDAISKPFRIPELWPKVRGLVQRIT
jgi:CheY-like chemotaxis protein